MKIQHISKPPIEAVDIIRSKAMLAQSEHRPLAILFVCLGNICRSPAAEGVMQSMAEKSGRSNEFILDSAGFYGGHRGDLPDPRMRTAAKKRGLELTHRSRTVRDSDFATFDLIFGMDDNNIDSLIKAAPTLEDEKKVLRMSDLAIGHPSATSVPDPYWDGAEGFEHVLNLLEDSCATLLELTDIK